MFNNTNRHYVDTDRSSTAMEESDIDKDSQFQAHRKFCDSFLFLECYHIVRNNIPCIGKTMCFEKKMGTIMISDMLKIQPTTTQSHHHTPLQPTTTRCHHTQIQYTTTQYHHPQIQYTTTHIITPKYSLQHMPSPPNYSLQIHSAFITHKCSLQLHSTITHKYSTQLHGTITHKYSTQLHSTITHKNSLQLHSAIIIHKCSLQLHNAHTHK